MSYICNMAKNDKNQGENTLFKKVISHAKEFGFIFPSSEIYDGLQAVYDYGQYGVELKNNIKQVWWKKHCFVGRPRCI